VIIVRTTWAQVPDGTLVVSPATGRIMAMTRKITMPNGAPGVELIDPEAETNGDDPRMVPVNPHDPIDMIETDSTLDRAVDMLSRSFALNRM
jgi:hypothetical protein